MYATGGHFKEDQLHHLSSSIESAANGELYLTELLRVHPILRFWRNRPGACYRVKLFSPLEMAPYGLLGLAGNTY